MLSISTIKAIFAVIVAVLPVPAPAKIGEGVGVFDGFKLPGIQGGEEGVYCDGYHEFKTTFLYIYIY